jgi:hypothetical protein
MALNNPAMVVAANALRAAMTHMQLHSGDPGAAGTANVTSAARQPVTWSAATADGDFGLSASVNFTGVAANGATTYVSLWSAITARYLVRQLRPDRRSDRERGRRVHGHRAEPERLRNLTFRREP